MLKRASIVCVVGPTGVGKTALAIDLCRRWGAELVGADASQVYRGMNIGTGTATAAELGDVRHHLINILDPNAHIDAADYARRADAAIAEVVSRGRRVVVCGGTGLWLRALLEGLCDAPASDPAVKTELRAAIKAGSVATLYAELTTVDPKTAARLAPADAQRIERALGVYRTTGKPLSVWFVEHVPQARYQTCLIGLERPRADLSARIEARTRSMFKSGFIEEVEALLTAGYGADLRSMAALGYRFIAEALAGERTMDSALDATIVASRRYSKRQMTWFRKLDGVRWFEPPVDSASIDAYVAPLWKG